MKENRKKILLDIFIGTSITVISGIILISILIVLNPFETKISVDPNKMDDQMKRISSALTKLHEEYIEDVSIEDLATGAIEGMTRATSDPYTRYVSEEEYNDMLVSGTEQFSGIGIHLTYDKDNDCIIVLSVMPDSPALQNGLEPGDLIAKVDDLDVNYDSYQKAVDAIKGTEGTEVKLKVIRNKEVLDKSIIRKKISVTNVESKVLDNNIGYIKILAFENEVANQFKSHYDKLKEQNVKGLIIDLRNNPGGLVSETISIAKMILPKGEIVKLVNKAGTERVYSSTGENEIKIPLTVLVNERSASASEILSGAIKDLNKGQLIGTKTYGKGIVQSIERFVGEGALSITTSKYYTSSGIEIHKNGIEPNISIELPEEYKNKMYIPTDKDTQLQEAIKYINNK